MDNILNLFHENCSVSSLAFTAVVVIVAILLYSKTFYIYEPGPWGMPILGFYPFLRDDYHVQLAELSKKYGDAYLLSMHCKLYLHLSSFKAVREAFVTKADCFEARSQDFSIFEFVFREGIFFSKGEAWRVLHKFLLQSIRELGLGAKEQLKDPLHNSIQDTLTKLKESKGEVPIDMMDLLTTQCTEVVKTLVVGKKVSSDVIQKLNKAFMTAATPADHVGILICGNIARYLAAPRLKGYSDIFEAKKEIYSLLYDILNEHKTNFDIDNPEDLIDLYLREKKLKEDKGDPQIKHLTDQAFLATLLQVYGDGGFTTGALLTSHIREVAQRIDIQNAIYEEILQEIGLERFATYEDRRKLPLTNAVIKELERKCTFAPVIPSLECSRDTTVSGVSVPKGTLTLVNSYAINNDPVVYKNPKHFDPQRFMPDQETKRPKENLPITFGIGRRSCTGESLVMTEMFMFFTAIIQHFKLELYDPNEPERINEKITEFQDIMSYRVIAIPRKSAELQNVSNTG